MRAVIESNRKNMITCSLCGYRNAPVYISAKKFQKNLAEGSAIIYYERKWLSNKKHQQEQANLIHKIIDDVFA